MSSERRSVDGQVPDGVVDRERGYEHNPNSPEEVAANKARFEANQRQIQQDRAAAADTIREVQEMVDAQYHEAQQEPEHQEFVAEQIAHQEVDPPHIRGGVERAGGPEDVAALPTNVEIGLNEPIPTTPREAEQFNNE